MWCCLDCLVLALGMPIVYFYTSSPSHADLQTEWPGCHLELPIFPAESLLFRTGWNQVGIALCTLDLDPQSLLLCRKCSLPPVSKCCVLKSQNGLWGALLNLHRPLISAPFPWALGYFYSLRASSHSSGAGRGGVHLALLLTQDKRAWGPQRFTLAARGFQNSKLFFITATWYEGRCSRCTQISRCRLGRVVEGEDSLKFALLSRKKKGPLSQWPFPFGWVKVSLLKGNLVLGQGGSTIKQQPSTPIEFHAFFSSL